MADRVTAYEEALRTIALAAVRCRQRVSGFHIPTDAAQTLLADVEHALSSLIVLGAVPGQPDPTRHLEELPHEHRAPPSSNTPPQISPPRRP